MASISERNSCLSSQPLPLVPARAGAEGDRLAGRCLAGRLRLVERVGHGAHGAVYRAEQVPLGREVTVEIVRATWPRTVMTFFDEAYEASRVHHPNVVTILDFGESDDGLLFLAMEHVTGVTLAELLDSGAPMPVPRVLSLALQAAMGLEAVHRAGMVHADLSSASLVIAEGPQGEVVKLLGLGTARRVEPVARESADTCPPAVDAFRAARRGCGAPGYVAPEVSRGARPGYASDVYAAGMVLYRLLTGARPSPGRTREERLARQLTAELESPSMRRAHVPWALESIVMRACARAPEERHADAGELRRALETVAVALLPGTLPCRPRQSGGVERMRLCASAHVS